MANKRLIALTSVALLGACAAAIAAGSFSTLPVVGQGSFCASIVSGTGNLGGITGTGQGTTGSICGQTVPQGPPSVGGEELIMADVPANAASGAQQQTVAIPSQLVGQENSKINRLRGSDFAYNLFQRGTTPLSGASPTTYQMSADGWFAISASNVMTVSKQTPATTGADYLGSLGLYSWLRVARPSGTPSGSSCVGQVLDQKASQALIGNNAVFSFYGYAPTTFSASNYAVTVSVAYYTAADSATGGTNTATFALSASGQTSGIAGYTAAVGGPSVGTTAGVASGVATINLSATPTRYAVYAPIPATNASGTEVLGVGVSICATPTLTTTVATDYFEIEAAQLQALSSVVATQFPAGIISPTGYERRLPIVAQDEQLQYSYVITDGAATQRYGLGQVTTTTNANVVVQYPVQMRETPALTVGTSASFGVTQAAGAASTCSAIAGVASSITPLNDTLACTTTSVVAGNATQFTGAATGGLLTFSAEP